MTALIVGVVSALAVGLFAGVLRLDRERGFYPTVMMVIALLYVLFAAIGGSAHAMVFDGLIAVGFIIAAAFGFKKSQWIVVAALAAHGFMDIFHKEIVENPGVPAFWPWFCSAYDVTAAAWLGWGLWRSSSRPLLSHADSSSRPLRRHHDSSSRPLQSQRWAGTQFGVFRSPDPVDQRTP
jgi:hypothetical protein